ncbi:alpha-1A adrenergic receptor-like [Diadema setosum]|uniref:alpha-1A adrenergic receptor-like n=1 Tax=Diadema setosum TaxID=31175 RepID=UPI003B3B780D
METVAPVTNDNILSTEPAGNDSDRVRSVYEMYGYHHVIIVSTLFSIIAFVGITGNILVFFAVSLSRKLHNVTNAFIVNLTVCDFLTCCVLPFHAVAVISEDGWPLADWFCSFIAALAIITNTCGILNLAAIALNRYILITKPRKKYMKMYKQKKVAIMIASTWIFPFIFLLTPQFFLGGLGYQDMFRVCIWNSRHDYALIFQGIAAIAFFVSTVIIIFSYVSIYVFVRRHMRMMEGKQDNEMQASTDAAEEESAVTVNGVNGRDNTLKQRKSKKNGISRKQIEITKNLCLVVVTFFICVLPYTIHLPTGIYDMRGTYFALLFMSHACINPILYASKHPHFKIIFKCIFKFQYSEIPMQTAWLKNILSTGPSTYSTAVSSTDGRFA